MANAHHTGHLQINSELDNILLNNKEAINRQIHTVRHSKRKKAMRNAGAT